MTSNPPPEPSSYEPSVDPSMSPEASPWVPPAANKRPLVVVGAALVVTTIFVTVAMVHRYQSSNGKPTDNVQPDESKLAPRRDDRRDMLASIVGHAPTGLVPAAHAEPPSPPPTPATPAAPVVPITSVVDVPPAPPARTGAEARVDAPAPAPALASPTASDAWQQMRIAALQQALVAPRRVPLERHGASGTTPDQEPQSPLESARGMIGSGTSYENALRQAGALAGVGRGGAARGLGETSSTPTNNDWRSVARETGPDRFTLHAAVQAPPSPYMLQAGTVIPAVCDSAINSELPGPLLGHVAQNVYSSTGDHALLAPQGTGIFGEYSADVVFGQERLLVVWERLTFPSGHTLDIGAMPGTDGLGRAGFADEVNQHYLRIYGSALAMSLVTAGVALSQQPSFNTPYQMNAGTAMSQALGLQFGQTTAQLLQKNMNIAPTIEIRAGFRFNIIVTKDIVFPGPYRRLS